ncbi:MAG: prepilin-type N-terminal cleavage/methylation domain-containing protein [Verrucomicrobia bacterium]|nr:prepilin-type N-terminal cleavage/methylation domain-containing protein [Verrucomicrobiota bacterium]
MNPALPSRSLRRSSSGRSGFTLVETIMSIGIIAIFLSVVLTTNVIAQRSYILIRDHDDLARQIRSAKIEVEEALRTADMVLESGESPAYLTLLCGTGDSATNVISFIHDPEQETFFKITEKTNVTPLLTDCEEISFNLLQRQYEPITTNTPVLNLPPLLPLTLGSCQAVEFHWLCRKYWDEEKTRPSAEQSGQILVRLRN